jgi:hypothetical protein
LVPAVVCCSPSYYATAGVLQPSAGFVSAAGVVACFLLSHRVTLFTRHRPGDEAILRRLKQRQLLCTSTSSSPMSPATGAHPTPFLRVWLGFSKDIARIREASCWVTCRHDQLNCVETVPSNASACPLGPAPQSLVDLRLRSRAGHYRFWGKGELQELSVPGCNMS